MSFVGPGVSEVRAFAPPYVDVVYPPEVLLNPLYLVINDPPGLSFPVSDAVSVPTATYTVTPLQDRILITINITEFNPGTPSSTRVSGDMRWMHTARRVDIGTLRLERGEPFFTGQVGAENAREGTAA